MSKIESMLAEKYRSTGPERTGVISCDGVITELKNVCDIPEEGFLISPEDIIEYLLREDTVATWHTHPGETSVLSMGDYGTFTSYPKLQHYIVGKDGVQGYEVDPQGVLIKCE